MDFSANISLISVELTEIYDSTEWASASIPIEAVISGGSVLVMEGSSTAKSQKNDRLQSLSSDFPLLALLAHDVTSDPVPAVVGTRTIEGSGFSILL